MFRTPVRALALVIAIAFSLAAHAGQAGKPQTTPELLAIAKSSLMDSLMRRDAITKLGAPSEGDERTFGVTAALIEVARTTTDPLLGKSAVAAVTQIQLNVNKQAKIKYVKPFGELLAKKDAIPMVRAAVAECFKQTLESAELPDKEAYEKLKKIAGDKSEQNVNLRARCIEAVGAFGIEGAGGLELLAGLLADPDTYIKEAAARAITLMLAKDPAAAPQVPLAAGNKFIEMIKDEALEEDLKVTIIKLVAQMIAGGNTAANRALEDIIKIVKGSTKDKLVLAAVEALGIIGSKEAAEPLLAAYADYISAKDATSENNIAIRAAIVNAFRSLLTVQAAKGNADMDTIKKVTTKLLDIVEHDPAPQVKRTGVYAVAYLYPKKFEPFQKEAVSILIFLGRQQATEADLRALVIEGLEAITTVNFGQDWRRWIDWATRKWPGPGGFVAP